MSTAVSHQSLRGQTSLEYLLLLAVVAVVVIAGFSQGGLISKVHDSAGSYYNTVTSVIMGTNATNPGADAYNPKPINGGWCPLTCPSKAGSGFNLMYRACECPAPAFGGAYCGAVGNPNPDPCQPNQSCKGPKVTCS